MRSNVISCLLILFAVLFPKASVAWETCTTNPNVRCYSLLEEKDRLLVIEAGTAAVEKVKLLEEEKSAFLLKIAALNSKEEVAGKEVLALEDRIEDLEAELAESQTLAESSDTAWFVTKLSVVALVTTLGVAIILVKTDD